MPRDCDKQRDHKGCKEAEKDGAKRPILVHLVRRMKLFLFGKSDAYDTYQNQHDSKFELLLESLSENSGKNDRRNNAV